MIRHHVIYITLMMIMMTISIQANSVGSVAGKPAVGLEAGSDIDEEKHPDQVKLQELFGIRVLGGQYVNLPIISPTQVKVVNGSEAPRPSFSHVYSLFDAGQKGCDPDKPGVWFRHKTVTLVLSYHYGCPVQIYKLHEGVLSSEFLGNPLENAEFRPTVVLWAGDLQSVESLCEDMFTFVSYVSVTGWTIDGSEKLTADQVIDEFPEHAEEIARLAEPSFSADQGPLGPEVYRGDWAPQ